jgi:DnaJ-class molecular chaperone
VFESGGISKRMMKEYKYIKCVRCNGKGTVWRTSGFTLIFDALAGELKCECPVCNGIGQLKVVVREDNSGN